VKTMTTDTLCHVGRGEPQGMIQINAYINDIYIGNKGSLGMM